MNDHEKILLLLGRQERRKEIFKNEKKKTVHWREGKSLAFGDSRDPQSPSTQMTQTSDNTRVSSRPLFAKKNVKSAPPRALSAG